MMANGKTIYIAGPMAGLPGNNFRAFEDAEKRLASDGWKPINPARFDRVFGDSPSGRLLDAVCESERAAIPHLDAIYLMRGWERSKGAKLELATALQHGLEVIVESEMKPEKRILDAADRLTEHAIPRLRKSGDGAKGEGK